MVDTRSKKAALTMLLLSVVLNAAGQLMLKATRVDYPDASLIALFLHAKTWLALILYGLAALIWLWVLSRAQLSFAYPVLALSFPIVVALSAVLFSESISMTHWMGVGVIVFGVSLLART
jgi:drug/metabolite transporter (DMT)-like permease